MRSTILIEKYLDGTLKGEKLKAFIHRLQYDSELQELVALHREVNDSIREEDVSRLRNKLEKAYLQFRRTEISSKESMPGMKSPRMKSPHMKATLQRRMLLVAAGLALIIILGVLYYGLRHREYTSDKLYSMYYKPYIPDIIIRSDNDKADALGEAILLYDRGNYSEAYDNLLGLVNEDSENYMARFYLGLSCMEQNKFEEAIIQFNNILKNCRSTLIYHSQWYGALCYLKTNNTQEAKNLLETIISGETYYRRKAENLIKKLD
jgi:tetratricopeptide (TPR) repeat protein